MSQRDDPYLQPNGTLRNKLGITDQALLSLAEADLVAARAKLLELSLPGPPFSFDTLKAIHHELFQDVYTWAGQARALPIIGRTGLSRRYQPSRLRCWCDSSVRGAECDSFCT